MAIVETGVTAEILQGRIQEVEASSALDEAEKPALLDLYRKSLGLINQRSSYESRVLEFAEIRETAPNQAATLREQLEVLEARKPPSLPASLQKKSLAQLEQLLLSEKAHLSGLRSSLAEAIALLEDQSLRSQQVRERLEQVRDAAVRDQRDDEVSGDAGCSPNGRSKRDSGPGNLKRAPSQRKPIC